MAVIEIAQLGYVEDEALAGVVVSSGAGSANSTYEVATAAGTAAADPGPSAAVSFAAPVNELRVLVETADVILTLSPDGTNFGDDVVFSVGLHYVDLAVKAFKHKVRVGASGATLEVAGLR